jgi:hypothetical protein
MLKKRDYTFKKARKHWVDRNEQWLINERFWRSKDYVTIKKLGYKYLYLDESAANENLFPSHGYSKKNVPYIVQTASKTQRITCLLCISEEKVIGCQLFDGSVTAEDYGAFILNVIGYNINIRKNLNKYVWYMDNASIHKARCIEHILKRISPFYGTPYSPFLNPIEEVFGLWKHFMRQKSKLNKKEII